MWFQPRSLRAHPKHPQPRSSTRLLERDSQEMEWLKSWRKWSFWHGAELCSCGDLCLVGRKKSPSKEPLLSRQKAAPCFEQSLQKGGKFSQKNRRRSCQLPSAALPLSRHPSPQSQQQLSGPAVHPIPSHSQTQAGIKELGKLPHSTHSHQADPLQARSQKSCWFFFLSHCSAWSGH